jgi:hypothetical protein
MRSPQSGARGWGGGVAGAIFSREVRGVLVGSEGGEETVLNGEGDEVGELGRDDGLAAFDVGVGVWV